MREAAAIVAPWTAQRPIAPQPIMTTDEPTGTSAVRSTAPTPVESQQPISAAASNDTSVWAGIAPLSGTTVSWAHDETPR